MVVATDLSNQHAETPHGTRYKRVPHKQETKEYFKVIFIKNGLFNLNQWL
jgi:hypothetical protein